MTPSLCPPPRASRPRCSIKSNLEEQPAKSLLPRSGRKDRNRRRQPYGKGEARKDAAKAKKLAAQHEGYWRNESPDFLELPGTPCQDEDRRSSVLFFWSLLAFQRSSSDGRCTPESFEKKPQEYREEAEELLNRHKMWQEKKTDRDLFREEKEHLKNQSTRVSVLG